MKEITLENFRCFHTKQSAHLAPLTLLVGENSTGKTSFLAAIRALWDCIYGQRNPNFRASPFDLGDFDDVSHRRSERSRSASEFEIRGQIDQGGHAKVVFKKEGRNPVPARIRFTENDNWIEDSRESETNHWMRVGTRRGAWEVSLSTIFQGRAMPLIDSRQFISAILLDRLSNESEDGTMPVPLNGAPAFSKEDLDSIRNIRLMDHLPARNQPYANAPARSSPRRTYDPASLGPDPKGEHVPSLLANLAVEAPDVWTSLKQRLEKFGSSAGIFDEIDIKRLAKSGGDLFQIQIRKSGKRLKGTKHKLMDAGYGISQILPILTELMLMETPRMALLQQPEMHLHPMVQAAFGSLLCEIAGQGRQIIVETHSDHLMDRVNMDVRDRKTSLKPEDVIILFFDRNDLGTQIHPIRLDEQGNYCGTPRGYRKFFMEETRRSLGLF